MPSRRAVLGALVSGLASTAGCQAEDGSSEETTATTTTRTTPTTDSTSTTETTTSTTPRQPVPVFDGREGVIVVNGYSTSKLWPDFLQRKLDRYFGGRVLYVDTAIEAGTPIAKWMDPDTGAPKAPWNETLAPALDRERPVVVLGQQSLQFAFGPRTEGIDGPDDGTDIERGADVLERYARALLEAGATAAFVATHIYKDPLEPLIGNERLALEAVLQRDVRGLVRGPDVWKPTKAHYPAVYKSDGVHPNEAGAEIMAHHWFRRFLESDGQAVPAWSSREMDAAIDESR